jgi:hypothetical protein
MARAAGDRQGVWWSGVGAPIAGAPMKAQARLGLALSWRWISSAFLIDVAVLILASHLPGAPQTVAWWVVNRLTGRQLAARNLTPGNKNFSDQEHDAVSRVLGPKLGCRHGLWVASRPPWYTWSPLARVSARK